jgi:hypothetical protein
MLSVVPGISTTMAQSLLAAYGSVAAVSEASPDGLRRHPGIGPVRAARLAAALQGAYVAAGDRDSETLERHDLPPVPPQGRWVLTGADAEAETRAFDRRAIALRALRAAAEGTQLIDRLTGEVLQH